MDGLLVIDKPEGPTSHDVVARMRRALRERRIGHTGTLDPMASGVLPLVVGVATRLARFHSGSEKRYRATVRFGSTTDTYDAKGTITRRSDAPLPSTEAVVDALRAFRGTFAQQPPAFSAKKVDGDRAYDLARKGKDVVLTPVQVTVTQVEVASWQGEDVVIELACSAGFYVRSLAHDLGQALGCGAHLVALRRTASGRLDEAVAVPLDEAERNPAAALTRFIPVAGMLSDHPAARLTPAGAERARHGNLVRPYDVAEAPQLPQVVATTTVVRLIDDAGHLLAVAEIPPGGASWPLHPTVVLA